MRSPAALALCLSLLAAPALAQAPKFKRCLSEREVSVEQLVHHGVFLREGANKCEEYKPGSWKKWQEFDGKFGDRLKKQTDSRKKVFDREFKENSLKVMTYFDGRLVTYHRYFPASQAYCENVSDLLDDVSKKGWGAFTKQAKVVQNTVLLDFRACTGG